MYKKIEEIDFNIDEKYLNKMINNERNQIFEYLGSKSLIGIIEEFDNFNEENYLLTDEEFKKEILEAKIPFKYETDFETNEVLRKGQNEKRKGNYEKAMAIYNFILLNAGPSGTLFIAMAKTRASQGYYEEAIDLFVLASTSLGCNKEICSHHVSMLTNRNKMGNKKFKEYLKNISGNPNFTMPKENKSAMLEKRKVKVGGFTND